MIAPGKISFATDSAVKNAEDTIREHAERHISYEFNIPAVNLKFFKECIDKVKLDDGQVIYIFQTSAVDGVIVKKIAIGPFEASSCCGRVYALLTIIRTIHHR